MSSELDELRKHLKHSKIAIFATVGFLALITYLLILVSSQVQQQAMTSSSLASEMGSGYQQALQLAKTRFGMSTGNSDSQQGGSTSGSSQSEQGQPSGACSAKGTITGPDRSFGKKLSCSYNCGANTNSKSIQKASGWTQAECQAEAERLCGCTTSTSPTQPPALGDACTGNWKPLKKENACFMRVMITCPVSGKQHLISGEHVSTWSGYRCYSSADVDKLAKDICCQSSSRVCGRFGELDKTICDANCQEAQGRDCVRSNAYPGTWTCDGNDPVLCPAPTP